MKFKAVLFDLGGTLIKTADIPEIFRRILKTRGIEVDSRRILEAHKANEKDVDVDAGQIKLGPAFWTEWNLRILRALGIADAELAEKIDELWWDYADLQYHHDVMITIPQLRAKEIRLGIVTNGLSRDCERIFRRLGGADYFDIVVGVDACSKAKPDSEIFLYALEKLQLRPDEAIFIGDSLERDYEGARKAGLKPLLIDREGKASKNVDSIRSLTEVLLHF